VRSRPPLWPKRGQDLASPGNWTRLLAGSFRFDPPVLSCRAVSAGAARRRAYQKCVRNVSACFTLRQLQSADLQALCASPLTDSNRRPPPYHAIQTAAGGSRRQRFPVSSSHFRASGGPNLCHPLRPLCSITVPSQSAQNAQFEARRATPMRGGPLPYREGSIDNRLARIVPRKAVAPTDPPTNLCVCGLGTTTLLGGQSCRLAHNARERSVRKSAAAWSSMLLRA
jgi:hypothetical protein